MTIGLSFKLETTSNQVYSLIYPYKTASGSYVSEWYRCLIDEKLNYEKTTQCCVAAHDCFESPPSSTTV